MQSPSILEDFVALLLSGDRAACRKLLISEGGKAQDVRSLYDELLWPAMERIGRLYRGDRINAATESMATRILRSLADQLQLRLQVRERNGKKVVIACAPGEPEELGAQMCADLFEAEGWTVYFVGGGIPNDEVLTLVGQLQPDLLLIFGTQPGGVPEVRRLVDMIREIGVNPTMNIMVSGGVFNRAEGLWKEVNADLFASSAREAIPLAAEAPPRVPDPPRTGPVKKRRRRRRQAVLETRD